ncbi:protein translocase subunit SecF [Cryobacterium sp. TMT1-21]|uniref:Protein-export membrane protein SecF n=1 Tax=Cryobacterium shii TaxID=1259235 RepID=A0AAQ2C8H6_9MICO|nr:MULTISPECIES: protein translocase subunit SecF [Cryobacterium]TFC51680.1 protein translocase subunit SecF [Cryobacterium shii]TFC83674.1 protein translocase subunit SecF [Cryobacterium sp. TmT2-59]TFD13647.1 protein translocase subunit SecF [Cryobacterium sp. TMT4-10]TFD15990.1 protein translocase subunit SecF [Cryobacterium sp. TMT1-21]TFD27081.1 protein translocase subunit SecF [Cryobacterium sp. TMT2-23]
MASFSQFGNDLHTGKRSFNIIGRRNTWYLVASVMLLIALVVPQLRGGFVFGIEFTGGSEFVVSDLPKQDQATASDAVNAVVPSAVPKVSNVGNSGIRVQTDQLSAQDSRDVRTALADAYSVPKDQVTASFIGPSWGADITGQALRGLAIFLVLAGIGMALYFRTWKMALAAMVALLHDLVITAGFYGITGFEITPAAVIGFLTILGYSLYDTVVVFDKIRENTAEDVTDSRRTFGESVNLAVNQTLVRSINTSVVAVLPVGSILFIGALVLGAGTLRDISLALLIGIIAGAYSTIFIASPLYAQLRSSEPDIRKRDLKVLSLRAKADATTTKSAEKITA